jgi:anti-anti-sigma factor
MKVKIWGARGSIPTPTRPKEIREKIVSTLLEMSKIEDHKLRQKLLAAIFDTTGHEGPHDDDTTQTLEEKRREVIQAYLDTLSPLMVETASGNTPCIEVCSGEDIFIIDAGSGVRDLGLELMQGPCGRGEGVIHMFFSHPHWDHIQGFPFFRPAFIPGNKIYIYSVHDLEAALRRQQDPISFPVSIDYMQAEKIFRRIKPGEPLEFDGLRIHTMLNHHPGDAYSFRFEKGDKAFVYASDAGYPAGIDLHPYLDFFNEADVLIFDAQFTQRESDEKEDWGHSSSFVGVEMAHQAKVENLVLFHYDPTYSDEDLTKILTDTLKFRKNQYPFEGPLKILMAREGQTFDLQTHQPPPQLQQSPGGRVAILKPTGIFNEHVANELREQLEEFERSEWPPRLIIDMSGVEMLQVTGLRVLVKLRKEHQGASMVLAGPSNNVQQLIELAGYLGFFAIYPSVHAALNALQAHETLNLPGQLLKGRYQVQAKIGDGRLGTIFKAVDTCHDCPVAIKILSASFSEGAIEQFLHHARQLLALQHPNIVRIYDCDAEHGLSFMVEEFIECNTLQDMLDEKAGQPLPPDVALSVAEKIAYALEYAHDHGVIHGDLKPKNVLLAEELKISDFGLGRLESGKSLLNLDVPLALVTACYVAPEQVSGHPIDARTDLYALGVILYQLAVGRPPFEGPDHEVLEHHQHSAPPAPRTLNPALSPSLEHLILKLLSKDPDKRYTSARQIRLILSSMVTATRSDSYPPIFTRRQWPALVGRDSVLEEFNDLWAATQQGRGQLLLINGESGIGKTRLLQEFIHRVDGATLLLGQAHPMENSPPYQLFVNALKTYFASTAPPVAKKQVGWVVERMAQLVPKICRVMPGTNTHEAEAGSQIAKAPASLARFIEHAAAERPWLLVFDDLHWADENSLRLLQYLARHCGTMRLMIVGTYQNDTLKKNKFLAEMLDNLPHHSILLERLSISETQSLLENIWMQPSPADFVTRIYRRTEGSPLYIKEISRELVEQKAVYWQKNQWHFVPTTEMELPQSIHDVVLQRINRLEKKTRMLLYRAAVLGQTFTFEDLCEMGHLSDQDTLESLDLAMEQQLIHEASETGLLYFAHAQIQRILYENLSRAKRRLMHHEAGETLEQHNPGEPKSNPAELAEHFLQAGELEKGLFYTIQAAIQAEAIYAVRSALTCYIQALTILEQVGMDIMTQQQRFELLLAREQVYSYLGERQAQATDLATLQTMAEISNDPAKQTVVHNRRAAYGYALARFTEAAAEAEIGLTTARQANSLVLEGKSLMHLTQVAISRGEYQTAREYMHAAHKIFEKTSDRSREAISLNCLGSIYRRLNDYTQAENYHQRALTMSQAGDNQRGQANCLSELGLMYLERADYLRARSCHKQALEINRLIGNPYGEAGSLKNMALVYRALGRYDLAQHYLEQAVPIRRRIADRWGQAGDLALFGAISLAQTEHTLACEHLHQALEIFRHLQTRADEAKTLLELGMAWEALGDLGQAGAAYRQAQQMQQKIGHRAGALEARAGNARCLLAAGQAEAAYQEFEPCLAGLKLPGLEYPIRLFLTAYSILQAAGYAQQATSTLQEGYMLLQKRADAIDEPDLHTSFLENVAENRELIAMTQYVLPAK